MIKLELCDHSVHLWRAYLPDLFSQENEFSNFLNHDEMTRANRFIFPEHRSRFVIARGLLRDILSFYTHLSPTTLEFDYGIHGKPFLKNNASNIHFNLSHSEDAVLIGITTHAEIGVDIQKIEARPLDDIAKRFFSSKEYEELKQFSDEKRIRMFYRLWTGKEALVKVMGQGLYVTLNSFTVALQQNEQFVYINHADTVQQFYLQHFTTYSDYESAFATNQMVNEVQYWERQKTGPIKNVEWTKR